MGVRGERDVLCDEHSSARNWEELKTSRVGIYKENGGLKRELRVFRLRHKKESKNLFSWSLKYQAEDRKLIERGTN